MGFFSSNTPKVSKHELDKAKREAYNSGSREHTLDRVEQALEGHMDHGGVTKEELDKAEKRLEAKAYDYGTTKEAVKKVFDKVRKHL